MSEGCTSGSGKPKAQEPRDDAAKETMSKFSKFGTVQKQRYANVSGNGTTFIDWKDIEMLRRSMSPNGKILGRKRLGTSALEQRRLAQAIKRARFMALLPYTSATL
jgi:small subunit ribosomal protein S18